MRSLSHSPVHGVAIQAIVFDMDGVIVDSHPAHRSAWREFLKSLGKEVDDSELDFVLDGHKRKDILLHFLGPLTEDELNRYGRIKEELFWRAASNVTTIPGAFEFIEGVHRAGVPMAVATSASTSRTEFILHRIGLLNYFRAIVTGDEVPEGKPNPDIYRLVCRRMETSPSRTLAFEDATSGIQAAKSAGLKCVAISTSQSEQRLSGAGADRVFKNFADLSLLDFCADLGIERVLD